MFSAFSSKIGRYLSPFLRWPLDDGVSVGVLPQPLLRPFDKLVQSFALFITLQRGLTLFPLHPQLGVHAVTIDGHGVQPLLLQQGKTVYDGKELADVVCAPHWSIVIYPFSRALLHSPLLHLAGIARTGCINGNGRLSPHPPWREGVVTLLGCSFIGRDTTPSL